MLVLCDHMIHCRIPLVPGTLGYVILIPRYKYDIVVITREAEYKC